MMRKAQGAIEYLFMIAAALVIILIVVKQLQGKGSTAQKVANESGSKASGLLENMSENATK
ncbi:class III signal peptide-containing protein [Thermococcus sp. 9N3]|uniref:class III signal peptide-containing protein n=1 Tax=Thermococcus sp. 9N3 TaxID=163002 RepID=UPI00143089AC|nr:class III signal peptide-containing protein [Thermococcus sp. 9N3]NJE48719.1 class III signal peptide-containing protein [Thermococcus sp. 9N3]